MDMDANNSVQIESYVFWLMAQVILLTLLGFLRLNHIVVLLVCYH